MLSRATVDFSAMVPSEQCSTTGIVLGDALFDICGMTDIEGAFLAAEDG